MNQSMITASVTMGQLQKKLDTISHNVANVNTNGYKRRDVQFQDLLFQQLNNQTVHQQETGRNTSNGLRIGSGARVSQTILRMEQGAIIQTERPLDIAIGEKGIFFEVLPTDENESRRFTRDGAFYLTPNPDNADELFLVTGDGDYVMSATGNAIAIPANYDSINVTETGTILVTLKGDLDTEINLGQLQLFRVTKPQLLESIGDNYFSFPNLDQLGLGFDDVLELVPENEGKLIQGALEGSNVDLGKELSELILAQRAYQFNTRSISMADQMMGLVNNIRG
ncbi:flagellar biosynthesis protein FlgG [Anaerobacillus alkalidiazotrophicus]|uniref:Flagellar biosynthesis protein FlgG n=1 Tax=Anaerobacillus alkalidiazotrophicus TaxID=472963 RepID=A0A1S2MDK4_9BACI|nr:flagellar hook-basal body protein [Anaerobacillus alkalidiazotrophicus]OIJ21765.1 flagellar biosynthesis protein FlgG [Anaerobacillus alkalidiazotrophicus]